MGACVGQFLLWTLATGYDAHLLLENSPVHAAWITWACIALGAVINALIAFSRVEIYRTVEIRADCMIVDGMHVFWAGKMESIPAFTFRDGRNVLCGIYGTRLVEYLTSRPTENADQTPAVLATHLQQAMKQMWAHPEF